MWWRAKSGLLGARVWAEIRSGKIRWLTNKISLFSRSALNSTTPLSSRAQTARLASFKICWTREKSTSASTRRLTESSDPSSKRIILFKKVFFFFFIIFRFYWTLAGAPEIYENLTKQFHAITGLKFPYKMTETIKFPGQNLSKSSFCVEIFRGAFISTENIRNKAKCVRLGVFFCEIWPLQLRWKSSKSECVYRMSSFFYFFYRNVVRRATFGIFLRNDTFQTPSAFPRSRFVASCGLWKSCRSSPLFCPFTWSSTTWGTKRKRWTTISRCCRIF